jgi:hypothetical protein
MQRFCDLEREIDAVVSQKDVKEVVVSCFKTIYQ